MNKKLVLVVLVFLSLSLVIGCNQEKVDNSNVEESQREVDYSKVNERSDSLFYVDDEDEPFTGISISYYENGQIIRGKTKYKEGRIHGESIGYYRNGEIMFKANYKDGEKHGEYIFYSKDGEVELKEKYEGGELVN